MNLIFKILFDNLDNEYVILIGCGLILGYSVSYWIKNHYITIPNREALTNEELQAILNEHAGTVGNNDNIDALITDSDFETDSSSDYHSTSDNESILSTSDDESILDLNELDLFFMPNVDLDVCSIQELKFFEIKSLYPNELAEKQVTDEELMDLICYFPEERLTTNRINRTILRIISLLELE